MMLCPAGGGSLVHFIIVSRKKLLRRLTFALLLAILAVATAVLPRGTLFKAAAAETDQPLTRAETPDLRAALTFDVTFGESELQKIQQILKAHDLKATFFVGGTFLSLYGGRVKQLEAEGHEIGTLGKRIQDLSGLTEQEVTTNLLESQSSLAKLLGGPVRYFRPPLGPATPSVVRGARAANLVTVTSSLDSEDHLRRTQGQIIQRVVRRAQKGDIILLSASDWSKETAKALPAILKGMKEKGFTLVPLSELVPADSRN
jgi:peptidoglycan/xylan/chitin deacetylase (PgdA/CDA1 family)